MRRTPLTSAVLLIAVARVFAAEPQPTAGKIDAVTVYRGQALVTRTVDAAGPAGLREIVVTDLPERIVPASLFAEAGDNVEVRGLRFRTRPVSQDVREEVRKLEAALRDQQDAVAANARTLQTVIERKQYLDRLDQFSAPTATADLKSGVLNADTLQKLTLFVFEQRTKLAAEELKLQREGRDLGEQATLLERQLNDMTRGAAKFVREAVLLADFKAGAGPVRVKYLVDSAAWSPSYVARADAGTGKRGVTVQYNASVQQQSGEDWADVQMTLSTATPSLVAAAPQLDALAIRLTRAEPKEELVATREKYIVERQQLYSRQRAAEGERNRNFFNGSFGAVADAANGPATQPQQAQIDAIQIAGAARKDAELNDLASKLQVLEFAARDAGRPDAARDSSATIVADRQEGVSVTYALPGRTSLPSRRDTQNVRIATLTADGEFYKLAMPVLTSYVYDQAQVANPGPNVLLAGPVASYLGGQYVGTGTLPTVAAGETFTVGFGIDASLRASRELVEKSETTQGGNRVMSFTYRLAVENFGKTPAVVRLTDRLPTSPDGDIRVTLVQTDKDPTTKPSDAATPPAKRTGTIAWAVTAAPETVGEKAASVQYVYKLEFDKQLSIAK